MEARMRVYGVCHRVVSTALTVAFVLTGGAARGQSVKPSSLKGQLLALGRVTQDPVAEAQAIGLASLVALGLASVTALETSTAPLGPSTAGFTFRYAPQLKVFVRSSESFGPSFVQRTLTAGKGKWDAGFNLLHASYNSLNGDSLSNGDLL